MRMYSTGRLLMVTHPKVMIDLNWWAEINLELQKDPGATGDDQGVGVNAHRHWRTEGLNEEIVTF